MTQEQGEANNKQMHKWINKKNKNGKCLCQLSSYFLWPLNLSLLITVLWRMGLCKPHFCFASWVPILICQWREERGACKVGEGWGEGTHSFLPAALPSGLQPVSVIISHPSRLLLATETAPPCSSSGITAPSPEILISALPSPCSELLLLKNSNPFHLFLQP